MYKWAKFQRMAQRDPSPSMKKTIEPTEQRISRKRREATEVPTESARSGMRAQGLRTRNAIVRVARKLLLESGSLEFTLREVALRAEISISNLQYYFPTRLAVLRAVVEPVIEALLADLKRAVDSGASPQETLHALVERGLSDAKNADRSALWWHFVSLAAIDPECSRLLDEWYETVTRQIAQIIRAAYPEYAMADCLHLAMLLMAMADGLSFQLGAGRRKRDYTRGIDAKVFAAVDNLLRGKSLRTRKS